MYYLLTFHATVFSLLTRSVGMVPVVIPVKLNMCCIYSWQKSHTNTLILSTHTYQCIHILADMVFNKITSKDPTQWIFVINVSSHNSGLTRSTVVTVARTTCRNINKFSTHPQTSFMGFCIHFQKTIE